MRLVFGVLPELLPRAGHEVLLNLSECQFLLSHLRTGRDGRQRAPRLAQPLLRPLRISSLQAEGGLPLMPGDQEQRGLPLDLGIRCQTVPGRSVCGK